MSLLDSFIECCEYERDELRHRLVRVESNGSRQEVEWLKQSIAELDSIIEPAASTRLRTSRVRQR